jgi:hypothetical protein
MSVPATVLTAPLAPGTRVELRSRYRRNWIRGFEVAGFGPEGYQIRRQSDHRVLPVEFPADQVRSASPPEWGVAR